MFDIVRVEMPLPDGLDNSMEWQTKDVPGVLYLNRWTIRADGRLIEHTVRWESVPKAERPYPDAPDGDFRSIVGSLRTVPTGDVEHPDFHGDLRLVDGAGSGAELIARFTEGRCVRIWRVQEAA